MATPLFQLHAPFKPTGDQPTAIAKLVRNLKADVQHQVLLGVTGSGKTFTVANVVNQIQRPTLVLAHNKTLAAQLAAEFREFFPQNAVHYFVSYYDYYQPEAYVPQTDTYIEKETQINEEIDRLRNAATQSLLTRPDVMIVASVSCIYGLGNPVDYLELKVQVTKGERRDRQKLLRLLADLQYQRNDIERRVGAFRVRGDTVEIMTAEASDYLYRISFLGDLVERIDAVDYITGRPLPNRSDLTQIAIFPAKQTIVADDQIRHQAMFERPLRGGQPLGLDHNTAPGSEQAHQRLARQGIVLNHQHDQACKIVKGLDLRRAWPLHGGAQRQQGHFNAEAGANAGA